MDGAHLSIAELLGPTGAADALEHQENPVHRSLDSELFELLLAEAGLDEGGMEPEPEILNGEPGPGPFGGEGGFSLRGTTGTGMSPEESAAGEYPIDAVAKILVGGVTTDSDGAAEMERGGEQTGPSPLSEGALSGLGGANERIGLDSLSVDRSDLPVDREGSGVAETEIPEHSQLDPSNEEASAASESIPDPDVVVGARSGSEPGSTTETSPVRASGRSLADIDLRKFEVTRLSLEVEPRSTVLRKPDSPTAAGTPGTPEGSAATGRGSSGPSAQSVPELSAGFQSVQSNQVLRSPADVGAVDGEAPVEIESNETGSELFDATAEVDANSPDQLPDRRLAGLAGDRITSEPQWQPPRALRSDRRAVKQSEVHVDSADAPPDTVRTQGEIRSESRAEGGPGGPRPALPAQPPKPVDLPTFNLEPARRLMMMVGDANNEVHVLVHEANGDVSIRFDAPQALRANLETSAHHLVESMSREQVSLTGMTFGGASHGDESSGEPRYVPQTETGKHRALATVSGESEAALPTLEFSETGSRIQLRV